MQRTFENLIEKAKAAANNAYAPYSNFKVGACVLFESGNTYIGCNVENASYGLSLCAERNAIATAIVNGENSKLVAIAIFSPMQAKCVPCGACRQWLYEFSKDTVVVLENDNKNLLHYSIQELLPLGFEM